MTVTIAPASSSAVARAWATAPEPKTTQRPAGDFQRDGKGEAAISLAAHAARRRAGHEVQAAFQPVAAGPAAAAPGARQGAGLAADGVESLVPQRVHDDVVLGDVAGDLVVAPADDGVDLDHAPGGVPLDGPPPPGSATRPGAAR